MDVSMVGAGNVASVLGHALHRAGVSFRFVVNRTALSGRKLACELNAEYSTDINSAAASEVIILAVGDDAIEPYALQLSESRSIIVHTSGSVSINVLAAVASRYGVLYPFQTLTAGTEPDMATLPFCIEASDSSTLLVLEDLAGLMSEQVIQLNSEKRRKLHLAGVFANNFTNHLIALAQDYLTKNDISPELLIPLLQETIRKTVIMPAKDIQTGPARRSNVAVIEAHKMLLETSPVMKNLYSLLTDSIIAYYSKST